MESSNSKINANNCIILLSSITVTSRHFNKKYKTKNYIKTTYFSLLFLCSFNFDSKEIEKIQNYHSFKAFKKIFFVYL